MSGGVHINVPGHTTNLAAVISIPNGAEIVTFDDGQAEITFNNGNTILLHSNNTLQLESPEVACTWLDGKCLKLLFGKVRTFIQCGRGRYCWRNRTPTVCACVRGTDFSVEHKQVGPKGRTTVAMFSGSVDVIANYGKITVVNAGEQVTIPTIKAMPWLQLLLD